MVNLVRRVMLFIAIIGFLACTGLWVKSNQAPPAPKVFRYNLKAFSKSDQDIESIKKIADEKKISYEVSSVQRFLNKKIGHRVVFYYQDEEALINMVELLKDKKVDASLLKDEESGDLYIQIGGNYQDEKKAEEVSKKIYEITLSKFVVSDFMKKFPYTTNEIILKNIDGVERAAEIKDEIKPFSADDVEIEEFEVSSDKDKAKPVKEQTDVKEKESSDEKPEDK